MKEDPVTRDGVLIEIRAGHCRDLLDDRKHIPGWLDAIRVQWLGHQRLLAYEEHVGNGTAFEWRHILRVTNVPDDAVRMGARLRVQRAEVDASLFRCGNHVQK